MKVTFETMNLHSRYIRYTKLIKKYESQASEQTSGQKAAVSRALNALRKEAAKHGDVDQIIADLELN